MSCRPNDDYSFSTGTSSPTYSTSNYDLNNNVDDVHDSVLALEYLAVLNAERSARMAGGNTSSGDEDVAASSARVGAGPDGPSQGTPSHNDDYSFSTGTDSPIHLTSNYDVNNNVDDVHDSVIALEYLAVLNAERHSRMAGSDTNSGTDDVAEGSAGMGAGSDGTGQGTPPYDTNPDPASGGEEVQGGRMGTPHPKSPIAITIGSNTDDDDDDDIRCGQCEDPIAYCHCEPLPVRARVVPIADTNRGGAAPAFPRRNARGTVILHDWTQAEDLNDDELNNRGDKEEEDDEEAPLPHEAAEEQAGEVVPY